MKHLKTYTEYNSNFLIIESEDVENFNLIFSSLYNNHLSINERLLIETNYGLVNESWFSDLVEKGKKGVLSIKTAAGELLSDLAQIAKDVLDFAKQLAQKIGDYVKEQFSSLKDKVKNHAMKDSGFGGIILEFLEKKKDSKLKTYISDTTELIKYIFSGGMINDLISRLSEVFSKVLNLGTNEGLNYLESDFLKEELFGFGKKKSDDEGDDKKSFLQRLGEKMMSFPPFSWIPKIEEMMKKGISAIGKLVDRFFAWLTTGKDNILGSKFTKSFIFLFQMLELYIHYKIIGEVKKFKDFLNKSSGLEQLTNEIKDKSLDQIWDTIGINGEEVVSNIKNAAKKIPYVGTILSILDSLVISIGTYLAVEPTLKKL